MAETEKNPRRSTSKLRCVIYTRKSTDEGLDQAFNSLDAQREACVAFIQSQKHEGWAASPTLYNDGGFSGGSLERPALRRLLADIEAGHGFKGNKDEARAALAEARRLNPKLSVKWLIERKPVLEPAFDVLRKAGLPEE
jgi:hypothetical protein